MPIAIVTCLIALSALIYTWYFTNRIIATAKKLPGIPIANNIPILNRLLGHLPLLGRAIKAGADPNAALLSVLHSFNLIQPTSVNGFTILWVGPIPILILFRPETAEVLLSSNKHVNKSFQYRFLKPWLGEGLLTSHEDKWKSRRRMLIPSFHFKILQDFVPIINGQVKQLVTIMNSIIDRREGFVDDLSRLMLMFAIDVIGETAMGMKLNAQLNPNSQYVRDVTDMGIMTMKRTMNPLLYLDFIFVLTPTGIRAKRTLQRLHAYTDKVIEQRKEEILKQRELTKGEVKVVDVNSNEALSAGCIRDRKPFMDMVIEEHLENPTEMTLQGVREEMDTFMFTGHDAPSWSFTWAIYLVGLHPDVQQKIFDEVDSIFGDDKERPITNQDICSMKYIECVFRESVRLLPTASLYARQLDEDMPLYVKSLDKTIAVPAGITAVVIPSIVHHCPDHWPDPERFIPERFLAENSQGRHPYSFLTWSAGPRNCVGQKYALIEAKITIASIFRRYKIRSLKTLEQVKFQPAIALRASEPVKIHISHR